MEALRIGNVDIDIRKHSLVSTPSFVQNDSNVIRVSIYDNGEPADLSNIGKVVVNYKRPDRQIISRELTRSNNVVDYKIGLPEMEKVGVAQVELQLYDLSGSTRLSLFRFSVNIVDEIGTQEVREDNDDVTLLQEIFMEVEDIRDYSLTQAEAAKKAAESAVTNWKQPVANKAAVDALPSPKLGDTVQTNDNGYVYRYDGKAWVKTQEYGATALANVNAQLADKVTKGQVTVSDIDKNKGKFDQTYLADSLIQQIAGTAPVNAIPADKSLTLTKFADTLSQMININGYKVFGGFTKVVKNADFTLKVSTTDFVIFSEDGTKKWTFDPVTDKVLNQRDILYADLTLESYNTTPHPLKIVSNGETINLLANRLPICANYWGRFLSKSTYQNYEKFNQIDVNTSDINALKTQAPPSCYFEKTGDSIFLYKPSKTNSNRYFKLGYQRDLDITKNGDVWRIYGAWVVEKSGNTFTNKIELHDQAEWEGVLLEQGKSDFMGGWHGDEKTQWINVWVDGQKINMTNDYPLQKTKKVEIVSATKLNRMDTPSEVLMDRTKRFVFDSEKFTVNNQFKALSVFTIADFYGTMCGILKQDWKYNSGKVTLEFGMKDNLWKEQSCNDPNPNILSNPDSGVKTMKLYSTVNNISVTVSSYADKNDYPNQNGFIQTTPYPKIYFHLTGGYTTKVNEIFRTKSEYDIEV